MKQTFSNTDIQCHVDNEAAGVRDSLYVNVGNNEPRVMIAIEDECTDETGPQREAQFLLRSENAQKIVDWLRSKGVVK